MAEGRLESIDGGVSPCAQVANGVAAVVAIQAAGLAVSQALWSGLSVFVSFLWGALVFREPIAHPRLAIAGAALGLPLPDRIYTGPHSQLLLLRMIIFEFCIPASRLVALRSCSHPKWVQWCSGIVQSSVLRCSASPTKHHQASEAVAAPARNLPLLVSDVCDALQRSPKSHIHQISKSI